MVDTGNVAVFWLGRRAGDKIIVPLYLMLGICFDKMNYGAANLLDSGQGQLTT